MLFGRSRKSGKSVPAKLNAIARPPRARTRGKGLAGLPVPFHRLAAFRAAGRRKLRADPFKQRLVHCSTAGMRHVPDRGLLAARIALQLRGQVPRSPKAPPPRARPWMTPPARRTERRGFGPRRPQAGTPRKRRHSRKRSGASPNPSGPDPSGTPPHPDHGTPAHCHCRTQAVSPALLFSVTRRRSTVRKLK